MPERYVLLSKLITSGFGPGHWVADETISDRVIRQGTIVGLTEIENIHHAAKVFADLLAEREYGESYSAVLVSVDVSLDNGVIFKMEAGTPAPGGAYYLMEPMYFAVKVKSKA